MSCHHQLHRRLIDYQISRAGEELLLLWLRSDNHGIAPFQFSFLETVRSATRTSAI